MSTTTSPAPVTPPPRLGATSHVEEPRQTHEPRWSVYLRWLGDATSIVLLIAVLWWLAYHDGGWERTALAQVGLLALAAVPAASAELRRVPRSVRFLVAWWVLGLVASLVFAAERSDFAQPTVTYSVVPVVGLITHRIWRRRWGPAALAGLLLVSFGLYWYRSFMDWWGLALMGGRQPIWRPLSWHNQSGTLMASFGLLFAGVAMSGRKVVAFGFGLTASAAFAGVWLSGSRGSLIVVGIGALLLVSASLITRRSPGVVLRSVALCLASLGVATALVTFASASSSDGANVSRVESASGDPAEANFFRRFVHMEAAVGMFADRPITGQGIGSYRKMSLPFTRPDSNLTSSAHNEAAEVLGEGGLLLALPFLGLSLVALVACWRGARVGRRAFTELVDEIGIEDLRWPISFGAAGTIPALLAHQAGDADWAYPILPCLLAVAVAIAGSDREPRPKTATARNWSSATVAVLLVTLLASGAIGTLWLNRSLRAQPGLSARELARVPVAWDSDRAVDVSSYLTEAGRYDEARWTLQRAVTWNPGYDPVQVDLAVVNYLDGLISGEQLLDELLDSYLDFSSANEVARALIQGGDAPRALLVLDALVQLYPRYEAWGIDAARADTWYLLVQAKALEDGCAAARLTADQARTAIEPGTSTTIDTIESYVAEICR